MIRILIIEDEIIIGRFIEQQLGQHFECTTQLAISEQEVMVAMEELSPSLVLCDINLEAARTGIELMEQLRPRYQFELIYITSYQTRQIIEQASATGPANYLIKPIDEMQLFAGVKLVMDKLKQVAANARPKRILPPFNDTERSILQMIRQQKTTREIAVEMHLSPYTVKNNRHRICRKLNLKDENNALLRWTLEQEEGFV